MTQVRVWDPFVRVFHWSLALAFAANALLIEEESLLHEQVGYLIVIFVLLRLAWGLVGSRHARFASFPPSLSGAARQVGEIASGRRHLHVGHTPLGALMIYNLLVSLLAVGLTGWLMTTDAFWGTEWTEELHELAVGWTEVSVVVHIAAVIFESRRTGVNLPRAMVTGYKNLPER